LFCDERLLWREKRTIWGEKVFSFLSKHQDFDDSGDLKKVLCRFLEQLQIRR